MALAGIGLDQAKNKGGISYFLIAPHSAVKVTGDASTGLATVTLADGTAIDTSNTPYLQYFPLKESSNIAVNITAAVATGTLFYEQIATAVFGNLSKDNFAEFDQLARMSTSIIAVDCDGMAIILGANCGCDMNPGTSGTGTAPGDLKGHTLSFRAVESHDTFFIEDVTALKKA